MNRPTGPAPRPARRLPPGVVPAPGRPPAADAVLRELASRLGRHGLTRLYGAADPDLGVLSLPRVTVWCYGHALTWTCHGQVTTLPDSHIAGAATRLAALATAQQRRATTGRPGS